MRNAILCSLAVILACLPAMAAGDHVELGNIGVTVSMEEEQTTISLFLNGLIDPEKVDTSEQGILVFDLPDVELTAADEGVTSFMVFSPSVASVKLTQLETSPYLTRLEIYTEDEQDYAIQKVGTGIDFIIFPFGGTPVLTEEPSPEEYTAPEEPVEEVVVEEPGEEIVVEPVEEEPVESGDPLGYKPIPADEWIVTETVEEEPVEEEAEVVEEVPEETPPPPEEELEIIEEIVLPEPAEPMEEGEESGFNLLEGVNLLGEDEEVAEPEEPVVEEEPVDEPMVVELETVVEETTTFESPIYVPTAGAVKLDNLNFQASDSDTDLLVFAMVDDYPGEARTNFVHKKGFIVLSHCDVSDFVAPGEFKTIELSGMHLRYIVININDAGEAVFTLILMDPEARYTMDVEIEGELVKVFLKLAE